MYQLFKINVHKKVQTISLWSLYWDYLNQCVNMTWMNNQILVKHCDVITHLYSNINGGLGEPSLNTWLINHTIHETLDSFSSVHKYRSICVVKGVAGTPFEAVVTFLCHSKHDDVNCFCEWIRHVTERSWVLVPLMVTYFHLIKFRFFLEQLFNHKKWCYCPLKAAISSVCLYNTQQIYWESQ